jgi:hypothetical protein
MDRYMCEGFLEINCTVEIEFLTYHDPNLIYIPFDQFPSIYYYSAV